MGSGKSTMAINHINANQNKKFLCIVPLLKECERYEKKTSIDIIDPEKWGSKWNILDGLSKMTRILLQLMH